nr:hypothetical protein [Tanacetum cinerariifolium]
YVVPTGRVVVPTGRAVPAGRAVPTGRAVPAGRAFPAGRAVPVCKIREKYRSFHRIKFKASRILIGPNECPRLCWTL